MLGPEWSIETSSGGGYLAHLGVYRLREAWSQGVRSGSQGVRESGSQGVRESGSQGVRK